MDINNSYTPRAQQLLARNSSNGRIQWEKRRQQNDDYYRMYQSMRMMMAQAQSPPTAQAEFLLSSSPQLGGNRAWQYVSRSNSSSNNNKANLSCIPEQHQMKRSKTAHPTSSQDHRYAAGAMRVRPLVMTRMVRANSLNPNVPLSTHPDLTTTTIPTTIPTLPPGHGPLLPPPPLPPALSSPSDQYMSTAQPLGLEHSLITSTTGGGGRGPLASVWPQPPSTWATETPGLGLGTGQAMSPCEFLSQKDQVDYQSLNKLPLASTPPNPTLTSPATMAFSFDHSVPSPLCGSWTSASLGATPMTRTASSTFDTTSLSGQLGMVRIQSQQSHTGRHRCDSVRSGQAPSLDLAANMYGKRPASPDARGLLEQNLSPLEAAPPTPLRTYGTAGIDASASSILARAPPPTTRTSGGLGSRPLDYPPCAQATATDMQRSWSKESSRSSSAQSLSSRAKSALKKQNLNGIRQIQPKPQSEAQPRKDAWPSVGAASAATLVDKSREGKAPISKARYERPKHPKVRCTECNEYPDGFRGDHELRRHQEAKHRPLLKKWICQDPDLLGIPHDEQPILPLNECKACSNQKPYGAYYNAAAHLRRTHFKPKPPRRKSSGASAGRNGLKCGGADEAGEGDANQNSIHSSSGKSGGDWPPMSELKHWMKCVLMPATSAGTADKARAAGEDDEAEALEKPALVSSSTAMAAATATTAAGILSQPCTAGSLLQYTLAKHDNDVKANINNNRHGTKAEATDGRVYDSSDMLAGLSHEVPFNMALNISTASLSNDGMTVLPSPLPDGLADADASPLLMDASYMSVPAAIPSFLSSSTTPSFRTASLGLDFTTSPIGSFHAMTTAATVAAAAAAAAASIKDEIPLLSNSHLRQNGSAEHEGNLSDPSFSWTNNYSTDSLLGTIRATPKPRARPSVQPPAYDDFGDGKDVPDLSFDCLFS